MKVLDFRLITAALFFIVVLVSCNEDESASDANSFSFRSRNYKLENGFINDYGANWDNTVRDYDVFLFSKEITLNSSGVGSVFNGTGSGINLEFNSPSVEELAPGEYQWDYFSNAPNALTFGRVFLNFNTTTHSGGEFIDANAGSATIEKVGETYKISFTLNIDGTSLKGTYSGKLRPF